MTQQRGEKMDKRHDKTQDEICKSNKNIKVFILTSNQGNENQDYSDIILHTIDWHKLRILTMPSAREDVD